MKTSNLLKTLSISAFLLASCATGATANDASISSAVARVLQSPNFVSVGTEVEKGDVTLTGTVNNMADASDLACRIASIDGVKDISSLGLKVLDGKFSPAYDARITTTIKMKLGHTAPGVSVTSNAGAVLLTGSVPSLEKAKEIEHIASGIMGVKCVVSHLTIK